MNQLLHELPAEHPLRTTPLRDIGAQVRNRVQTNWRDCSTWRIGASTYNALGPAWTETNDFRATKPENAK